MKKILFILFVTFVLFLIPGFKPVKALTADTTSVYAADSKGNVYGSSTTGSYYKEECTAQPLKEIVAMYKNTTLLKDTTYKFNIVYTIFKPNVNEVEFESTDFYLFTAGHIQLTLNNYQSKILSDVIQDNIRARTYAISFEVTSTHDSNFYIKYVYPNLGTCIYGWNFESTSFTNLTNPDSNNTDQIIDNANSNTQATIDNNNANTDKIIDNANQNADKITDSINENFNNCRDSYNLFDKNKANTLNAYIDGSNKVILSSGTSKVVYIPVKPNTDYVVSKIVTKRFSVGISDVIPSIDTTLTAVEQNYTAKSIHIRTSSSTKYLVTWIYSNYDSSITFDDVLNSLMINEGISAKPYEEGGKICSNRFDELNKTQQDTNDKLQENNDLLNDDKVDDANNEASSFFNDFDIKDNGGISSIVTMPLKLINGLVAGNTNCDALSTDITLLEQSTNISIPSGCIIWKKVPNNILILVQLMIYGVPTYTLLKKLFHDIENLKSPDKSEVSTLDL